MIPLKLTLCNFMCYKGNTPPLDMRGFHLACLCGDNGAGKSALLDAITWALWGESRAKSDDELIHLGQTDMEVELEFEARGNRYRVIRKRSRGVRRRAGRTVLELHLAEVDAFRPLTGNSVKETEQKIIQILRMDYRTFINSAFLLQGRFDEFTRRTPLERKEILGEILGLSQYDALEEQAKDLAKAKKEESLSLESAIKEMDRELAHKEEYKAELQRVKEALDRTEKEISKQETELKPLKESKGLLEQKKRQLEEIERAIQRAKREMEQQAKDAERQRGKIAENEGILKEGPAISEGYQALLKEREANEELNRRLAEAHRLSRRRAEVERSVNKAREEIQTKVSTQEGLMKMLEPKIKNLPRYLEELAQTREAEEKLEEERRQLDQKKEKAQELRERLSVLRAASKQLEKEVEEIEEKIELLGQAEARCPLCGAELTSEHQEEIRREYEAELRGKREGCNQRGVETAHVRGELDVLNREVQTEGQLTSRQMAVQGRVATLGRDVEDARKAQGEAEVARQSLYSLREQLERKNYAPSEQKELEELTLRLSALKYDEGEHKRVGESLRRLAPYEGRYQRLQQAKERLLEAESALRQTEERLAEWQKGLGEDSERRDALQLELKPLPQLEEKIERLEESLNNLQRSKYETGQELGRQQQKLAHCIHLEGVKKAKSQARLQAEKEKGIYEDLAEAFGKKGIQALLIEQAIPELEVEANKLLSRMTDNRMHVKIETQRESKKGETLETLDIKIADELGTRSYELYSGGEAFRINLALRIALSRLLARRAGAPLPTLFIDEGFGTQDISGREKVLDAINSIKDDFERVLVITHIDELKEAFPVRIEVTKTEDGSTFRVT